MESVKLRRDSTGSESIYSISSSSSCNELSLSQLSQNDEPSDDADYLYNYCIQSCEFCDKQFSSRYGILVHTAEHIIIPLINYSVYECHICGFYFTSQDELVHHKATKHITVPEILQTFLKKEPIIQCDNTLTELLRTSYESTLKCFVKTEPVVRCHDTVKEIIRANKEENLESIVKTEAVICCDDTITQMIKNSKTLNGFKNEVKPNIVEKLSSKLVFEDDDDVTFNNNFNDNGMHDILLDNKGISNQNETIQDQLQLTWNRGMILLGSKKNKSECSIESLSETIHYDILIGDKPCKCSKCGKTFPNRYKAIIHETVHIKMRKSRPQLCTICERFIGGGWRELIKHQSQQHPNKIKRRFILQRCKKCNLNYSNYYKHEINYHLLYVCRKCGKRYERETERSEHLKDCAGCTVGSSETKTKLYKRYKVIKVCEVCSLFLKNSDNRKYVFAGELSEVGQSQKCLKCEKTFFQVKLFQRTTKFSDTQLDNNNKVCKAKVSNESRLKNIQSRLKIMKKMNRL